MAITNKERAQALHYIQTNHIEYIRQDNTLLICDLFKLSLKSDDIETFLVNNELLLLRSVWTVNNRLIFKLLREQHEVINLFVALLMDETLTTILEEDYQSNVESIYNTLVDFNSALTMSYDDDTLFEMTGEPGEPANVALDQLALLIDMCETDPDVYRQLAMFLYNKLITIFQNRPELIFG